MIEYASFLKNLDLKLAISKSQTKFISQIFTLKNFKTTEKLKE